MNGPRKYKLSFLPASFIIHVSQVRCSEITKLASALYTGPVYIYIYISFGFVAEIDRVYRQTCVSMCHSTDLAIDENYMYIAVDILDCWVFDIRLDC